MHWLHFIFIFIVTNILGVEYLGKVINELKVILVTLYYDIYIKINVLLLQLIVNDIENRYIYLLINGISEFLENILCTYSPRLSMKG